MNADTPPPETAQDIQVRLKPLLGVEPKHYLAFIYVVVIIAVLFGLLVMPGLTRPGTRVTFTSTPPGADVVWGTKHWGSTPLTVYLPQGKSELTITKPGFQPFTQDYTSGNSVFFSLFLPRSDAVSAKLSPVSAASVTTLYRLEVGKWALAVPFTNEYRFPPLFTRFAADGAAAGLSADQIKDFLLGLRQAVADPQMYLDYGRALGLWSEVPEGMETQYNQWKSLVDEGSGRLALWLLANQTKPIRDRQTAEPSDWFLARIQEFQASLKVAAAPAVGAAVRTSLGAAHSLTSGAFVWGVDGSKFSLPVEPPFILPVPSATNAFWIADSEVTQAQFAAFVSAKPEWAPAARDALVAAGKADSGYLADWSDGRPPSPSAPVDSVSWYAAQAYVDWVNASGLTAGRKAVLPDDFQWEAAARSSLGPNLLNQGVWEWTASAWYPGDALVWSQTSPSPAEAYARSLKGGTAATKGNVGAWDRAGWPAASTTPNLGFRLAFISP